MAFVYEYIDGQRVEWNVAAAFRRMNRAFRRDTGCNLKIRSGTRTTAEQTKIFLERYVTADRVNGRRVYDTRWWAGKRWYRISPLGTVAIPRTSNHEEEGPNGPRSIDIYDTGPNAGVTVRGTARDRWMAANAGRFGFTNEGYNFSEPWHKTYNGKIGGKPSTAGGGNEKPLPTPEPDTKPEEEDDNMKIFGYKNPDDKNRMYYVEMDSTSGFWNEWVSADAKYITSYADKWTPNGIPELSLAHRNDLKTECDRISGRVK